MKIIYNKKQYIKYCQNDFQLTVVMLNILIFTFTTLKNQEQM